MMVKTLPAILVSLFLFSSLGSAQQDPMAMKEKANSQVMTAAALMKKATETAGASTSAESRQLAISLFVEAGQLFEQAAAIYQALGPNYATAADVQNAQQAMKACIENIQKLKQAR